MQQSSMSESGCLDRGLAGVIRGLGVQRVFARALSELYIEKLDLLVCCCVFGGLTYKPTY